MLAVACVLGTAHASTVFICRDAQGHRSIQDRPCTSDAASRTVTVESRAPAPAGTGRPGQTPMNAASRHRDAERGWTGRDASRCRQYQEGTFQVQARMRAGYSVSEGERLQAGLDKLNGMLETRCRKIPQRYWIQGNASDDPPA